MARRVRPACCNGVADSPTGTTAGLAGIPRRSFSVGISVQGDGRFLSTEGVVAEIDDVAVVGMGRARVYLLAADVGEDGFPVVGVRLDQPMHFGKWRCDTLLVGVVEGEAHAEDVAPHEALAGVCFEPHRVGVAAPVEQEGGDGVDVLHRRVPWSRRIPPW